MNFWVYDKVLVSTTLSENVKVTRQATHNEAGVGVNAIVRPMEELVLVVCVTDSPQVSVCAICWLIIGCKLVNQLKSEELP